MILKKRRKYFKAELRLLTALTQDYNIECQQIIARLFPSELLVYCLNSRKISNNYKRLFIDLLYNLYLNYYLLGKPPKSFIPEVLSIYQEEELIQNRRLEKKKLFSLHYFNIQFNSEYENFEITYRNLINENKVVEDTRDNKFSILQREMENQVKTKQPVKRPRTISAGIKTTINLKGDKSEKEKIADFYTNIYYTRVNLHKFVISVLQKPLNWESSLSDLKFYISFFKMLNLLILRKFFGQHYNDNLYIIYTINV